MNTQFDTKSFFLGALAGALLILAMTTLAMLLIWKGRTSPTQVSAVAPEAWEYNVIRGRPPSEMQDRVNGAAQEGWELISAFPYTDSAYAVMRRLKK